MRVCVHTERKCLLLLVIDHLHAAVLLDPQLTHDDVVHAAGGVGPGVGFVVPAEMLQLRAGRRWRCCGLLMVRLPGQLQGDGALGLGFDALPPELELGVDGAVEDEVVLQALGLEGANWGVMAHLLRHPPEAQVLSDEKNNMSGATGSSRKLAAGLLT